MRNLPVDLFRMLFADHPLPMWIYDRETLRFLDVNEAAITNYRYTRDEFLAMRITDIRPAEDVSQLLTFFGERENRWFSAGAWRHRDKHGRMLDVEITSHPVPWGDRPASLVIAQDVSERRRLETQLRQSQKMEALGRLAGGVAHDFNNVLTAILGYATLLIEGDLDERAARIHLEQIRKAAERARSLTVRLLAFSRQQMVEPKIVDVNSVVDEMAFMLGRLVGEHVQMTLRLDPRAARIKVDPGELAQVLTNLAVNARDAMPSGGRLAIETANVELDVAYARTHINVTPGSYVMIAVSDSGHGIAPDVQERMFEPFFTTKPAGKGTGLGLAMVYGIVKQRRGHIWVYSEPGRGTVVKVYFPRLAQDAAMDAPAKPLPIAHIHDASATILVAEDDEDVRLLVRDALERRGYTVLVAATPDEALQIASEQRTTIRLLVTDVVMPGLNGPALVHQMKTVVEDLSVIYMSGFSDEADVSQATQRDGAAFLQKPFTLAQLEQTVHRML